MAEIVYLLCGLTSITCMGLLFRGYYRSRVNLLLWSALCFAGLALNNVLLVIDLLVLPGIDLSVARSAAAAIGLFVLVYAFIWELP